MAVTASWLRFPRTKKGSGRLAFWITAVTELALSRMDPQSGQTPHFWVWLIALPTCSGLLSALIYGYIDLRGYEECLRASQRAVASFYVTLLAPCILLLPIFGRNILGLYCAIALIYGIGMAPLAILLAAAGGTAGYWLQRAAPRRMEAAAVMSQAWGALRRGDL